MIAISACLAGKKCRYDGKSKPNDEIQKLMEEHDYILFCPECTLEVPRQPSEIVGGEGKDVLSKSAKVMSKDGKDVTTQFIKGAQIALDKIKGAEKAYMKDRSPSCGCTHIYDGTFNGKLRKGMGVAAQLFKQNGIEIVPVD